MGFPYTLLERKKLVTAPLRGMKHARTTGNKHRMEMYQ